MTVRDDLAFAIRGWKVAISDRDTLTDRSGEVLYPGLLADRIMQALTDNGYEVSRRAKEPPRDELPAMIFGYRADTPEGYRCLKAFHEGGYAQAKSELHRIRDEQEQRRNASLVAEHPELGGVYLSADGKTLTWRGCTYRRTSPPPVPANLEALLGTIESSGLSQEKAQKAVIAAYAIGYQRREFGRQPEVPSGDKTWQAVLSGYLP